MQTNLLLSPPTLSAIDRRVERLLKDLGNPEPPINLDDVRRLLNLDLAYYSSTDTTWLQEKIHQLRVAGKQVLSDPSTILSVTRSLGLKGVLLVDRRRILLDKDVATPKLRWNEAHEITHDILPWHDGVAHGDPETTLSPACHELIEAEANYGAGRIIFCGQRFTEVVRSSSLSFDLVKRLQRDYGNTMTTTLWRLVEGTQHRAFGIVSVHPSKATGMVDDVRYFVRSPSFAAEYAGVTSSALFHTIRARCHGRRGPIGSGMVPVIDDRGDRRVFAFETFWNGYDALTLAHSS